jgi:hypothetical protein
MAIFALMFAVQGMYRAFNPKVTKTIEYHRTWSDEVPGYPASDFVKNL